jgi:hypothetical protein
MALGQETHRQDARATWFVEPGARKSHIVGSGNEWMLSLLIDVASQMERIGMNVFTAVV